MRDEYEALRIAYRLGITPEEAQLLPPTRGEVMRQAYRSNTPINEAELDRYPETERDALRQLRQSNLRRGFSGEQNELAPRSQGPRMSPARGQPSMAPAGEPSFSPVRNPPRPPLPGAAGRGFPGEENTPPRSRQAAPGRVFPGEEVTPTRGGQGPRMSDARGQPSRGVLPEGPEMDVMLPRSIGPDNMAIERPRAQARTPEPARGRQNARATEPPAPRGPGRQSQPRDSAPRESEADQLNAISQAFLRGERPRGGAADNIGKAMGIEGYKKGGLIGAKAPVKKMAKGGMVKVSAPAKPSRRGDGCATRGKTKGRMV